MRAVVVVAFAVFVIVAVTIWPLLSTTAAFACFGAAHVVVELRYIAGRFQTHLARRIWWQLGAILAVIVVVRSAVAAGAVSSSTAAAVELLLAGAALAIGVRTRRSRTLVGGAAVAAIVVGAWLFPLHTLLLLSVLHNITPIGFVVERAAPASRHSTLLLASLVMCGVPLLVASGVPLRACADHVDVVAAWPTSPALYEAYAVWLTPSMFDAPNALPLFSAAVSAQLLHYGAVLWWLPREARRSGESSPASTSLVVVVVASVVLLALGFALDFRTARVVYGLLAAVHAWIELPVLFVALSAPSLLPTTGPA